MKIFKVFTIFIFFLTFKATAGEIAGSPIITDGDTIKIINKRIRLHGIDAPERKQLCKKNFKEYRCGIIATEALVKKINKNQVRCIVQDMLDRYKRYIGVCFVEAINLNQWMVRNGHAVAYRRYSKDYIKDEDYAKKNKLGLWSGDFINPEKWRKLN
ncbi:thermonuclease family protein [Candidatus Pelagibacter bacterium]|nr:thermonuclease family protein [Candidatus Pelagibacter bacterium]